MKRLYIGGLSHAITQKDLRDRFGKFGDVSDVEIITRKDEDGAPLKTFAYVNITISDNDYKRCVTVLNKSKWKGGTLQIELAKESFLHRLTAERQQTAEKIQTPKTEANEKILESFKTAGVENFHMKAAVPGTEIPGHKNWVVSKFGRVLPVVHLKCQGKNKISFSIQAFLKYDPSKHCHNIKKLEIEDSFTPVSRLTWQIEGGDDEISKRRRGEFPPQKKRPTKIKKCSDPSTIPYSTPAPERWTAVQGSATAPRLLQGHKPLVCVLDSDADTEDELRMLVTQELSRNHKTVASEDEGNLEVVGDDFVVKSSMLKSSDEEYDSADTDEILTQNKNPGKAENLVETETCSNKSTVKSKMINGKKPAIKKAQAHTESESDNDAESSGESIDSDYEAMMGNCQRLELSLGDLEALVKNMEDEESSDEDDAKAGPSETSKTSVNEPSPQKAQSKKSGINPEDILASLFGPDEDKEEKKEKVKKSCLPAFVGTKDLFRSTNISTGLKRAAEKVNCEFSEEPKRLRPEMKNFMKTIEDEESSAPLPTLNKKVHRDGADNEMEIPQESKKLISKSISSLKVNDMSHTEPKDLTSSPQTKHSPRSSSSSDEDEEEEEEEQTLSLETKTSKKHESPASDSTESTEESETSSDEEEQKSNKSEAASQPSSKQMNGNTGSGPQPFQQSVLDPEKQQQDNLKRLAAVEQRQKETEQQKKLIQGALSKVDLPNASKGKHIVFDSDDEVNNESENPPSQKANLFDEDSDEGSGSEEKQILGERKLKKAEGSRLFDSSEDEDDGNEEDRFMIKPQFEGSAGQKLMELQSRFGTDPRFQMDAKFLESDDEEQEQDMEPQQTPGEQELAEEKKKNLSILQSVLNVSIQPSDTSKQATKGKIFKDISALHYDPSSETHAAFETKTDTPKKESKAARRKKREEAMKLPEVSKDIYYDVTTDLKEVFGMGKEIENEKKAVTWDQDDDNDEKKEEVVHAFSFLSKQEAEPSSGFKFSFFGDDAVTKTPTTDEYKVELIKGAKVPWQVDPRFQDSSSEEEEEEKEEKEEAALVTTTDQPALKKKFFFFFEDDIRLKEGPSMFCRREKLEDQREAWEEKRNDLREEYRKKHKDAKRQFRMRTKT
ncbi:hypothetical protein QTP70_017213 [Hemibagrus guttatus]|uniref:Nucleolar protein 8 n=1 Tax=Hemibagrus guttatus TaxID=175788 RepID=A0AAE0UNX4_9TELE|nr:hypothetical protein QTP70_017213 [Hemibagrus guttatus]